MFNFLFFFVGAARAPPARIRATMMGFIVAEENEE
jgi:hypothetical protein